MSLYQKNRNKNNKETLVQYYLKSLLIRIDKNQFYQYINITVPNLECELCYGTGKALINGRQLKTMAKRGLKSYRKALSYANEK